MEQLFENENKPSACDVFMNEMEIENGFTFEENLNFQTKGSKNLRDDLKKMKQNLQKLHVQRRFLKPHSEIILCLAFYCVSDNKACYTQWHLTSTMNIA
jgi:hypothetical protein